MAPRSAHTPSHLHILLILDHLVKFQVPLGAISDWLPAPHIPPSHLHILLILDHLVKSQVPLISHYSTTLHPTKIHSYKSVHLLIDPMVKCNNLVSNRGSKFLHIPITSLGYPHNSIEL